MSYFDVPVGRCEVMKIMVATDQTEEECRFDNGCLVGRQCSLAGCHTPGPVVERGPLGAPAAWSLPEALLRVLAASGQVVWGNSHLFHLTPQRDAADPQA